MVQTADGNSDVAGGKSKRARDKVKELDDRQVDQETDRQVDQQIDLPADRPTVPVTNHGLKVKIVRQEGAAVLVEWFTGHGDKATVKSHRGCIPPEDIGPGNLVNTTVLDAAIPYGEEWEKVVDSKVANELRRVGIWTANDLLTQAHLVPPAVQRGAVLPIINTLREFARKQRAKQL